MKIKKLCLILATSMILAGCGGNNDSDLQSAETAAEETTEEENAAAEETSSEKAGEDAITENEVGEAFAETVKITFMNSKPEITDALEEGAGIFGEKYNVEIEIYETDSPTDTLAQKYAAGDAPTVAIVDNSNVIELSKEKIIDLSDQPWNEVGGKESGSIINDKVYGMPLTIEAEGFVVNKTVVEELTGREFKVEDYATLDEFEALLEELRAAGMEYPVALNSEDWSIGGHLHQVYMLQDGTQEGGKNFLKDIREGNTTFSENDVYNEVMDTLDVYIEYNINHADPLAADYDLNASYVAEGEAAFWLNGTWAWPDFAPYATENMEYDLLAFPMNNCPNIEGKLTAYATKYIVIDGVNASEEQQQAAKMFLNWLVFDAEGQDVLINKCEIVTAFSNITLPPSNPLNVGMKEYMSRNMTVEGAKFVPSDHKSSLAANMQAYLGGVMTREEVAEKLDEYWSSHTPN